VPILRILAAALLLLGAGWAAPDREPSHCDAMKAAGTPGFAYAVVEDGAVRLGGEGVLLRGEEAPVRSSTPFLIGSLTKSMTAAAIMQLEEEGQLTLDDPLSMHLPALKGLPSGTITLRALVAHRSGYTAAQSHNAARAAGSSEELARALATEGPKREAGEAFAYANANYILLGAVIEAATGRSYAEHLQTAIFEPLGMHATFVADGRSPEGLARGHRPWFGGRLPVGSEPPSGLGAAAGGVVSTADDLARYMAALVNGEDDVLSARAKAELFEPVMEGEPAYGYGWFVDQAGGRVYHGGLTPGVETLMVLSLETRSGAVGLANANSGLAFGPVHRLLWPFAADALRFELPAPASPWGPRSVYLTYLALPVLFVLGILACLSQPSRLRSKAKGRPLAVLLLPSLAGLLAGGSAAGLVPGLFGLSLESLGDYQPDFALLLLATMATSVLWVGVRLAAALWPLAATD
jgi:CubicO group peptidase (beta-lactamase class C family)